MPKAQDINTQVSEYDTPYEPSDESSLQLPVDNLYSTIRLDPTKPLSPYQNREFPRRRPPGQKKPWTDAETEALEKGMIIFGNDWKAIKAHFSMELAARTNVNLKDRARNVKKKLQRTGAPLGIWEKACNPMIALVMILLLSQVLALGRLDVELDRAYRLIKENILIDSHNDFPEKLADLYKGEINNRNLDLLDSAFHTDFDRMQKGGVKGQIWSAYVKCWDDAWSDAVLATLEQIDLIHRMIQDYSVLELALTSRDIRDIAGRGKIASLIGLEGGHSIGDSVAALVFYLVLKRMMYKLGARYMTLTHTCHTKWADSCAKPGIHGGLSSRGIEGIREMNRLGIMIDISHVSVKTMSAVLEISKTPVIFSHSSSFSKCNNSRNVPDEILLKLKEKDGVVMVNFYPLFITCSSTATLLDVANHIDHIGNVAGREHVGFGSDFDGIESVPIGLQDVSRYPFLVAEMIRRGWSDTEIIGLIGENFLRVFKKIEDYSTSLKPSESRFRDSKTCLKTLFYQQYLYFSFFFYSCPKALQTEVLEIESLEFEFWEIDSLVDTVPFSI